MLQLPACLDIAAAGPLAQSLLAMRGSDATLDASAVERLGAQCVQVLLSAQRTWQADKLELHVTNPSAEFLDGIRLLGIPQADLMIEGGSI